MSPDERPEDGVAARKAAEVVAVDAPHQAVRARAWAASAAAGRARRSAGSWSQVLAGAVCVAVGLLAGTAHAEQPAGERKRVAVLELAHAGPLADDVLRVSADLVRGAALKRLPRSAWQVMTRENIFELLPPGTDLSDCVADCEVETGRRLGAWLVVTGEVAQLGAALTVSLKAHRTDRGELVAQSVSTAAAAEGLWTATQTAAGDLFTQVAPPEGREPAHALAADAPADREGPAVEPRAPAALAVAGVPVTGAQATTPAPTEGADLKRRVQGGPGPAGVEWVSIPGGTFTMGSDTGDPDERPLRTVSVPDFELMKTEVTNAVYARCVSAGACTPPSYDHCPHWQVFAQAWVPGPTEPGSPFRAPNHPVVCVDWAQASAFAAWAEARLPTEAEWEYAARSGGRPQPYPWGDAPPTCGHAVMEDGRGLGCGAGPATAPVCSKPSGHSAQGVCDLAGNAWEWVADVYGPYRPAPADGAARVLGTSDRVYRGGGWFSRPRHLRAAARERHPPDGRSSRLGFRLAR